MGWRIFMQIIVTSKKDPASLKIKNVLLEHFSFEKLSEKFHDANIFSYRDTLLITAKDDLIYLEYLDDYFNPDFYIFASRHSSQSRIPGLLVHTPGNWASKADLGGNPNTLAISNPKLIKLVLARLMHWREELKLTRFQVTMEVTHHGPTQLKRPITFVEVGSSIEEWNNGIAAQAVAFSIMESILKFNQSNYPVAIGFGGTHYCPSFNKISLETEIAFGHMAPKYAISELTSDLISQAIKKNYKQPDFAVLDWKGLPSTQRESLISLLDKLSFPWKKSKEIKRN